MRYNIEGFSQIKLQSLGLNNIDALLLRWFLDFSSKNSMKTIKSNNKTYFWVNYGSDILQLI